ncbi:MAG: hypothetical protein H6971_08235, partial [Gammaproteobacteria bacterium]|nr:hypothetical protein [Gammaproteobacteria bacterium]
MEPMLERYLRKIKSDYGTVDARGVMQVRRIVELPLDEVFVSLTAKLEGDGLAWIPGSSIKGSLRNYLTSTISPELILSTDNLPEPALPEVHWARSETGLSLDDLWKRNDRWVLLGDPGAGKTTLW